MHPAERSANERYRRPTAFPTLCPQEGSQHGTACGSTCIGAAATGLRCAAGGRERCAHLRSAGEQTGKG